MVLTQTEGGGVILFVIAQGHSCWGLMCMGVCVLHQILKKNLFVWNFTFLFKVYSTVCVSAAPEQNIVRSHIFNESLYLSFFLLDKDSCLWVYVHSWYRGGSVGWGVSAKRTWTRLRLTENKRNPRKPSVTALNVRSGVGHMDLEEAALYSFSFSDSKVKFRHECPVCVWAGLWWPKSQN